MREGCRIALMAVAVTTLLWEAPAAGAEEQDWDVFFVRILRAAEYGLSRFESAAWLVEGPAGSVHVVPWQAADHIRRHSWKGALPSGTVALLHTHPAEGSFRPSWQDQATAERLRLPVFTVSLSGIFRADPSGEVTEVRSRYWTPAINWSLAEPLLARGSETELAGNQILGGSTEGDAGEPPE